jgi:hypothetical protein
MVVAVPPLVISIPATLALGVQIAAPVFGLATMVSVVVDCSVQTRFGFFDGVLALGAIVGVNQGHGNEP